jgi:hypothetical protein
VRLLARGPGYCAQVASGDVLAALKQLDGEDDPPPRGGIGDATASFQSA